MKILKVMRIEAPESRCICCNWGSDAVYVAAATDAEGYASFQQKGGMCAECFLHKMIVAQSDQPEEGGRPCRKTP